MSASAGDAPAPRPPDPERGLRGALSGALVLQGITVLLAIPVATNTGSGTSGLGVVAIVLLALAAIALCAFVRRSWFPVAVVVLEALTIAGWLISAPLGVVGIIFAIVFAVLYWFRHEYRRRAAAGLLPGQQPR